MCQPGWERALGENGYMYTYGQVPSMFQVTTTALLISYTPVQNVFGVKKEKKIFIIEV